MQNFENWRKKQHLREVLLGHYFSKRTAAESHRLLVETYEKHSLSKTQCFEWFHRFKNDDFDINDKDRSGRSKKFDDEELKTLLSQDSCQTQEQIASSLKVDRSTVAKRLQAMGMIQKQGKWVPYELKSRDVERRLCICEQLLQRQKRKSFLHRIVTGDEKWIYYSNPKRKRSWGEPGHASTSTPKRNTHGQKIMLSIWWDQLGIIYHELLQPNETITGDRYRLQLMRLSRALKDKRPYYADRHDKVILLHDNARPHVSKLVNSYIETLRWEVLPHPPYSPDIAPSDYHLFRSMSHSLADQHFHSYEDTIKWLDSWIFSKNQEFFQSGIRSLPERWEQVVASGGQYF